MIEVVLIIVVVSYFLGSIPFGYLLVRMFRGIDVRGTGSGNIGATNVARTGSKGLAIATLVLDALKGYAAVSFALWIANTYRFSVIRQFPDTVYDTRSAIMTGRVVFLLAALAAFVAILGHVFTVWLRFKGGKGVATAAGSFIALAPRAMLVVLVLFILIVALTRYVSLGSIAAAAGFPIFVWWLVPGARSAPISLLTGASSVLIILRHKDNIRRLLAGTENRFR